MSYDFIISETAGGVMKITLNRPEVLNSFNVQMARELRAALDASRADKIGSRCRDTGRRSRLLCGPGSFRSPCVNRRRNGSWRNRARDVQPGHPSHSQARAAGDLRRQRRCRRRRSESRHSPATSCLPLKTRRSFSRSRKSDSCRTAAGLSFCRASSVWRVPRR